MTRMPKTVGGFLALGLAAATLTSAHLGPATASDGPSYFNRTATYPVFQNLPAVDQQSSAVAEISAVSDDGKTLGYTDAAGRIGFLDITDPNMPKGLGTLPLAAHESPTSIAFHGGYLLAVIDQSTYPGLEDSEWAAETPAPGVRKGRLDVIELASKKVVKSFDLGGQPDSIAVSSDDKYAAIAIENQRNEAIKADGGVGKKGDLPQAPAGFVQLIDLEGATPEGWSLRKVALTNADGTALQSFVDAKLDTPADPEPEYVAINDKNELALTMQENNGVAIIDLATGAIKKVFSAGSKTNVGIDNTKDGLFNPTAKMTSVREPDSIGWIGNDRLATANEGDWKGGSRGWTIFDTDGDVVWDAGNTFENLATRLGLHNNDRAAKKGAEPEGLAIAEFDGTTYAFVGSERSNFVAVYDVTDPASPVLKQALPATNGPEGLLPIPSRNLLAVSSETDDPAKLVRASVGLYELGANTPAWPNISSKTVGGFPIGWGALGALAAKPGDPTRIWAASDSAFKTGRIYSVNVSKSPALIESVIEVSDANGTKPAIDIEGLTTAEGGGFWLANEGTTGAGNQILRTDANGVLQGEPITLPEDVAAKVGKWGFEGITRTGSGATEKLYVAMQRPQFSDPVAATGEVDGEGVTRIGRYDVTTKTWEWFGYQLEKTTIPGDWMGLSEIVAIDDNTLAVVERDKQNGTTAAVKRIYRVTVPAKAAQNLQVLPKTLMVDMLPKLRAPKGWTQEKLEGLTIAADRKVYAVTDNDGLKDATGETQFIALGQSLRLPAKAALKVSDRTLRRKQRVVATVTLAPADVRGTLVIKDNGRVVKTVSLTRPSFVYRARLKPGTHKLTATFKGSDMHTPASTGVVTVKVARR